jgi:RNA:NAD 2'-phosphotransferase (TPT1/KptA family)
MVLFPNRSIEALVVSEWLKMMDKASQVKVSKFLSKHLRPEALGLVLADGGWVEAEARLS